MKRLFLMGLCMPLWVSDSFGTGSLVPSEEGRIVEIRIDDKVFSSEQIENDIKALNIAAQTQYTNLTAAKEALRTLNTGVAFLDETPAMRKKEITQVLEQRVRALQDMLSQERAAEERGLLRFGAMLGERLGLPMSSSGSSIVL